MPVNSYQWFQYALISYLCGIPLGVFVGAVFGLLFRVRRLFTRDRGLLDI